jgi:hypothetical protein
MRVKINIEIEIGDHETEEVMGSVIEIIESIKELRDDNDRD